MNVALFALGVALIVAATVDLLWTALWVDGGAGPISARLSTATWRGLKAVGSDHPRILSLAGPLILVFTLFAWIGLLWAGWTVLFLGANQDSFATGRAMRMKQGNVRDFDASADGVQSAVTLAADAVYAHRSRTRPERRLRKDELFDIEERDDS